MDTKELVKDSITRSLEKYHNAFTKVLKNRLNDLEDRLEIVEDSALNIQAIDSDELKNIISN